MPPLQYDRQGNSAGRPGVVLPKTTPGQILPVFQASPGRAVMKPGEQLVGMVRNGVWRVYDPATKSYRITYTTPQTNAAGAPVAPSLKAATYTPPKAVGQAAAPAAAVGAGTIAAKAASTASNTSSRWQIGQVKKGKGDYDVSWNGRKWVKVKGSEGKYTKGAAGGAADTAVAPGSGVSELPDLSPEELAMLDSQRGGIESRYQGAMSLGEQERVAQSLATQEALRQISRGQAGETADWASAAAETGMGLSPAMAGVGQASVAGRYGQQRRQAQSAWADALSRLGTTQAIATAERNAALEAVRRQQLGMMTSKSNVQLGALLGG